MIMILARSRPGTQLLPKRYQTRVVAKEDKSMRERITESQEGTWLALDGQDVGFRAAARPRAHYLYYHYSIAIPAPFCLPELINLNPH